LLFQSAAILVSFLFCWKPVTVIWPFCANELAVTPVPDRVATNKTAPRIFHYTIIREER
jgi:hypothetical protein